MDSTQDQTVTSRSRHMQHIQLLDDRPIDGSTEDEDILDLSALVRLYANTILNTSGPMVLHVDGGWGEGKTSFCKLLEWQIKADLQDQSDTASRPAEAQEGQKSGSFALEIEKAEIRWLIASDREQQVTDALLYTLASAITENDTEEARRILRTWGSRSSDAGEGELIRLEGFREWAGRELGWSNASQPQDPESKHGNETVVIPLANDRNWTIKIPPSRKRIAVVIIDDLDRCAPSRVVEIMDAVRSFVNCPGAVFVIAADRAIIEQAFSQVVQTLGANADHRAHDALEKYIRHHIELPKLGERVRSDLSKRVEPLQRRLFNDGKSDLLHGPAQSEMADGVGVFLASTFKRGLTPRRLKLILNRITPRLAAGADHAGLGPNEIRPPETGDSRTIYIWNETEWKNTPIFIVGEERPYGENSDLKQWYRRYFVTQLVVITLEKVWPEVLHHAKPGSKTLADRLDELAAVGGVIDGLPERLRETVIDRIVPADPDAARYPDYVKIETCRFLRRLYEVFDINAPVEDDHSTAPRAGEPEAEPTKAPQETRSIASAAFEKGPMFPESPAESIIEASRVPLEALGHNALQLTATLGEALKDPTRYRLSDLLLEVLQAVSPRLLPTTNKALLERTLEFCDRVPQRLRDETTQLVNLAERARALQLPEIAYHFFSRLLKRTGIWQSPELPRLYSHYLDFLLSGEHFPLDDPQSQPLRRASAIIKTQFPDRSDAPGQDGPLHLRYTRLLLKLVRLLESRQMMRPEDEELKRRANRLVSDYEQRAQADAATVADVLNLVRVLDAAGRFDLARWKEMERRIQGIPKAGSDPHTLELNRTVADALIDCADRPAREAALELYQSLQGSRFWTFSALHNLATLRRILGRDEDGAGQLWEAAYRNGYRNPRMQRAFNELLREHRETAWAMAVAKGEPLPDERHPFSDLSGIGTIHPE